ncbi:MAG: hypothetical protein H0T53_08105 [Herpetosiphonaceae bacterium]|nr:hypothetical protein [Herpetosiphonaceae bacterium]
MRKFKMVGKMAAAFVMLFVMTAVVAAQSGLTGTGWYTTAVIQNVGTTNGTISLEAFALTGGATGGGTASTPLNAGSAVTFRPDNPMAAGTVGIPGIASGSFQGSMVLSSDVEVVSVAFVNNAPLGTSLGVAGGKASAAYNGIPQGSTTLTYPAVKSGFNGRVTSFFIQATGAAATVSVSVVANNGVTYTKSGIAIEANKSYVLLTSALMNGANAMPGSCSGSATSPTGAPCIGAMTLTSTAPVAGTVVEYPTVGAPATVAMSTNMFAASAAGTKLSCPTVKNRFPAAQLPATGIAVQNVSGAAQDITVTIVTRLPVVATYTRVFPAVPNGASVVASRGAGTLGGMPDGAVGAATITAAGNVIAIASETGDAAREGMYACMSSTTASTKVAAPVSKFEFPSKTNAAAGNTGINVQNVGNAATTITGAFNCRNTGGVFTNYSISKPAAPGASAAFSPFTDMGVGAGKVPTGSLCSAVFTATQPVVAIANESTEGLPIAVRDSSVYEGFTLTP